MTVGVRTSKNSEDILPLADEKNRAQLSVSLLTAVSGGMDDTAGDARLQGGAGKKRTRQVSARRWIFSLFLCENAGYFY